MFRLLPFLIALAWAGGCNEEFKPPPKKEAPTWGKVEGPNKPVTVAELIGKNKNKFGFETIPLLGASPEEVTKTYGGHMLSRTADGKLDSFKLPGWLNIGSLETSNKDLEVSLVWDGDKVFSYEFVLPDSLELELMNALTARGPATGLLDRNTGVWFGNDPATTVYVVAKGLRVVVRSESIKPDEAKEPYPGRKTAAEIIGTDPDKLAFQEVPLLGAKLGELPNIEGLPESLPKGKAITGRIYRPEVLDLPGYYGPSQGLSIAIRTSAKSPAIEQFEFSLPRNIGFEEAIVAARGPVKETKDDGTEVLAKGKTFLRKHKTSLQVRVGGEAWLSESVDR
jgi:hypothetical protein